MNTKEVQERYVEFEWSNMGLEVEIDLENREIRAWEKGDEEVWLIFSEDDFLSGNFDDFVQKRGQGYEIYSYTLRGDITRYYIRKRGGGDGVVR